MMSPDEQDRELSRLYQHTTKDGSPAQLDQRILEAAQTLAPPRRLWWRQQWMPALSAVLVLGLAITLLIPSQNEPSVLPVAPRMMQEDVREEQSATSGSAFHDMAAPQYDMAAPQAKKRAAPTIQALKMLEPHQSAEADSVELDMPSAVRLSAEPEKSVEKSAAIQRDSASQLPRAWLLVIEAMLDNNQPQAAKRQFKEFRQLYPAFVVEKNLLERLAELD